MQRARLLRHLTEAMQTKPEELRAVVFCFALCDFENRSLWRWLQRIDRVCDSAAVCCAESVSVSSLCRRARGLLWRGCRTQENELIPVDNDAKIAAGPCLSALSATL